MPSLQSLTTSTVSDELRGSVLGIYQSVISLSIIVSTAIAGVLYAIRPNVPFWIGGALSLLATLPAVALLGHGNNRMNRRCRASSNPRVEQPCLCPKTRLLLVK